MIESRDELTDLLEEANLSIHQFLKKQGNN